MGTPRGGILSPLLANIALSVLDDHYAETWEREMGTRRLRERRRHRGGATYRLVRYVDDFVAMIAGTKAHSEELKVEVASVLATMGLRLSPEKTMIVDIDEGFEFLGFRIQRQRQQGSNRHYLYTWPSKKSLTSVKARVKTITRQGTNQTLADLLRQLNGVPRGWTNYFRHGVSHNTFRSVPYRRGSRWVAVVRGWSGGMVSGRGTVGPDGPDGNVHYVQARYLDPIGSDKYDNPAGSLGSNPRLAWTRTPNGRTTPGVLLVTEGIPDALTAAGAGYAAVGILGSQAPDDRVADVLARHAERSDRRLIAIVDADPAGRASGSRLAELLASRGQPLHVVEPPDGLDLNGWASKSSLWTIAFAPEALQPAAPHETRLEHLST